MVCYIVNSVPCLEEPLTTDSDMVKASLMKVGLQLKGIDPGTTKEIIDLIKQRILTSNCKIMPTDFKEVLFSTLIDAVEKQVAKQESSYYIQKTPIFRFFSDLAADGEDIFYYTLRKLQKRLDCEKQVIFANIWNPKDNIWNDCRLEIFGITIPEENSESTRLN